MILPKPIVIGPPRGGFFLLIHICNMINGAFNTKNAIQTAGPTELQRTIVEYSHYLLNEYKRTFIELGIEKHIIFSKEFHPLPGGPKWIDRENPELTCIRKYIGIKNQGDMLLVVKHPRKVLEFYPVIHSHDNPKAWLDKYYDGFVKLAASRHPMGILESSCFSLNAMASEYIQRFAPNLDEEVIRQKHGAYKLTDLKFFGGLARYLTNFLDEFVEIKDKFFLMKWEDLLLYPENTIQKVGTALGIRLSYENAKTIWDSMSYRNLLQHHKHNYRDSKYEFIDSWKKRLVNEHLRIAGFSPCLKLNEYTPFQKLIANYIQNCKIFYNVGDPELFNLAFNKSNIDVSEFEFKTYEPRKWVHVERSTIKDDNIVETIADNIDTACDQINLELEKL